MRTVVAIFVLLGAIVGTCGAQTPVVPKSFAGAKQPQVAVKALGDDVFVTFGKGDSIYVARSTNYAKSFDAPQLVGSVPKLALGMRRGPRIVSNGGPNIAVSAISHEDGNLYCWVSKDDGAHWTQGARVNDVPGAAREGLHAMASDNTFVAIAWLDLRTGKTELSGAISDDHGLNWSTNFLIYQSPDGHICECCHPSLAFRYHDHQLFAMWRNWLEGARDMYVATISPVAAGFGGYRVGPAHKLGTASWKLNACPMDGGGITFNHGGLPITVWRREGKIVRWMGGEETVISNSGSQPCIAAAGDSVWIVYQDGDKLMSVREQDAPKVLANDGKYPAVAGSWVPVPSGNSPIAVWETGDDCAPIAAKKL